VVGLEPSCTAVFRSDAAELFPDDQDVLRLRDHTLTLAELLAEHTPATIRRPSASPCWPGSTATSTPTWASTAKIMDEKPRRSTPADGGIGGRTLACGP